MLQQHLNIQTSQSHQYFSTFFTSSFSPFIPSDQSSLHSHTQKYQNYHPQQTYFNHLDHQNVSELNHTFKYDIFCQIHSTFHNQKLLNIKRNREIDTNLHYNHQIQQEQMQSNVSECNSYYSIQQNSKILTAENQQQIDLSRISQIQSVEKIHLKKKLKKINKKFKLRKLNKKVQHKSIRNQTKNIPKNFGKAIITYISRNLPLVLKILSQTANSATFNTFMTYIKHKKRKMNSIADLRSLWLPSNIFSKALRILSHNFLKKHSLEYIFNSRVCNFKGHVKYRERLMQALVDPNNFNSIKMY